MNISLSILFSLLLASVASAGSVQLLVKQETEKKQADKTKPEITRTNWLNVRITNTTGTKLDGVTLKWSLYSAALRRGADTVAVEKSGELKITVDANGRYADVTTPKVAFLYTPEYTQRSGRSYKTVEASGKKYHGYHVQVVSGDTVLGEVFSDSVKKHVK